MIDRRNILNIAGVAEYTTLSKPMIYKLICQNKIPFHKLGNRTVFLTEEIDDWVRNDGKMVENILKCFLWDTRHLKRICPMWCINCAIPAPLFLSGELISIFFIFLLF
jgi:excisionase family DNA binding protein